MWPALEDAAFDDAREAFAQALHLQRSAGTLHKELKAAEMALATEPTDENYRHLVEIQAQFRDVQATEALIEGFGIPSGRADAEFLSMSLIRFFNANHATRRLTFGENAGIRSIRNVNRGPVPQPKIDGMVADCVDGTGSRPQMTVLDRRLRIRTAAGSESAVIGAMRSG